MTDIVSEEGDGLTEYTPPPPLSPGEERDWRSPGGRDYVLRAPTRRQRHALDNGLIADGLFGVTDERLSQAARAALGLDADVVLTPRQIDDAARDHVSVARLIAQRSAALTARIDRTIALICVEVSGADDPDVALDKIEARGDLIPLFAACADVLAPSRAAVKN